jgi:hypothetical protein
MENVNNIEKIIKSNIANVFDIVARTFILSSILSLVTYGIILSLTQVSHTPILDNISLLGCFSFYAFIISFFIFILRD